MQIVILCGGEGTRLAPLTNDTPKPLMRVCGVPILERILDGVKENGFPAATLTIQYQAEKLIANFDSASYHDIALDFRRETFPLGTAGCVRNCWNGEEVLVLSGDALQNFNLAAAVKFHRAKKADVTIVTKEVADPREFGIVRTDKSGQITGFLEKPSYESCPTNAVNTGVYVLSKAAMNLIELGKKSDFAKDLFPKMMAQGMKLYGYPEQGYWLDIGSVENYAECQRAMLYGETGIAIDAPQPAEGMFSLTDTSFAGATIRPPVYIGKNVTIGKGSVIEEGTVLEDDVTVEEHCWIHASTVGKGTIIGSNAELNRGIIGRNVRIMKGAQLGELSAIGSNTVIGEHSQVYDGVKIWAGKTIANGTVVSADIRHGSGRPMQIDDEGSVTETTAFTTPATACEFGMAAASALDIGSAVIVGFRGKPAAKPIAQALSAGVTAAGVKSWFLGECTEHQLAYCMKILGADMACYVQADYTLKISVTASGGLPVTRQTERKIEMGINHRDYRVEGFDHYGGEFDATSMKALYEGYLDRLMPRRFRGVNAEFRTTVPEIARITDTIFTPRNDLNGERVVFHLGTDAKRMSAYSDRTGYVFHERLVLLGARINFDKGLAVSLPYSFPVAADELAEQADAVLLRYYNCPCDDSDKRARQVARRFDNAFVRDSLILAAMILTELTDKEQTLRAGDHGHSGFPRVAALCQRRRQPARNLKEICRRGSRLGRGRGVPQQRLPRADSPAEVRKRHHGVRGSIPVGIRVEHLRRNRKENQSRVPPEQRLTRGFFLLRKKA
ncbi:MAG: sugar phosphate nucleotidyltransferase [Oscillospiraceae bacterium]